MTIWDMIQMGNVDHALLCVHNTSAHDQGFIERGGHWDFLKIILYETLMTTVPTYMHMTMLYMLL